LKVTAGMVAITPSRALTWRKTASGYALYVWGRGKALATVEPDVKHAGMWRIHMPDGWVSDKANPTRAKEGAVRSVLFILNRKETASGAAPMRETGKGGPRALAALGLPPSSSSR